MLGWLDVIVSTGVPGGPVHSVSGPASVSIITTHFYIVSAGRHGSGSVPGDGSVQLRRSLGDAHDPVGTQAGARNPCITVQISHVTSSAFGASSGNDRGGGASMDNASSCADLSTTRRRQSHISTLNLDCSGATTDGCGSSGHHLSARGVATPDVNYGSGGSASSSYSTLPTRNGGRGQHKSCTMAKSSRRGTRGSGGLYGPAAHIGWGDGMSTDGSVGHRAPSTGSSATGSSCCRRVVHTVAPSGVLGPAGPAPLMMRMLPHSNS